MPRRARLRAMVSALAISGLLGSCNGHADRRGRAMPAQTTARPRAMWLKGQLHAHTNRSGDSQTPPERAAAWYARHGYDFLVLTDHNRLGTTSAIGRLLVARGVELTLNLDTCMPEERGHPCLLHVNALFARARAHSEDEVTSIDLPALVRPERRTIFGRAIDEARRLGAIAQINHPNFHYAASGALLAELARRGARLVEVANEASDSNNAGDATHPSTEALWDDALSRGAPLYATATDDAHHYDDAAEARARGEEVFTGDRGFVMVRSRERTLDAIRAAIERGDFYASNGVVLDDVQRTDGTLHVTVAPSTDSPTIAFIGRGGRELERISARTASYRARADDYVRATVTDRAGRKAWTQPVRATREAR